MDIGDFMSFAGLVSNEQKKTNKKTPINIGKITKLTFTGDIVYCLYYCVIFFHDEDGVQE